MKKFILLSVIAVFAASCASQKYSRTANITDDVYFSPNDAEKTPATNATTGSDGFTYDQTPVTTNPNAVYRHYQAPVNAPDTTLPPLNVPTTYNYTTNNYYNGFSASPFGFGMMYPGMGYGWQIGMGFGYYPYGYMPYSGYGYNPFYNSSCFYPSYGYGYGYSPYGYYNPWYGNSYCGNNNWYNGWSGSSTTVMGGPRVSFSSPFAQTIIGPNGQRVRMTTPIPPAVTKPIPPAVSRNNPNLPAVQPHVSGQQPHTPTNNDGNRVVYPRQQYTTPAQPAPARPAQPQVQPPVQRQPVAPPAQPARPAQPQVQPPVQRQPMAPPVINNPPPAQNQPVYRPQNTNPAPQRPAVTPRQENRNNTPQINPAPSPGRGSTSPGPGGSGGTTPRRR